MKERITGHQGTREEWLKSWSFCIGICTKEIVRGSQIESNVLFVYVLLWHLVNYSFIISIYNLISLQNSWKLCVWIPGEPSPFFYQEWGMRWNLTEVPMVWKEPPCCLERWKVSASGNGPFWCLSLNSEGKQNTFPTSDFMTSPRTTLRDCSGATLKDQCFIRCVNCGNRTYGL